MNFETCGFFTFHALPIRYGNGLASRCFPAYPISPFPIAALPSWVVLLGIKFRLPFRHTPSVTECLFVRKFTFWPSYILAAPCASARFPSVLVRLFGAYRTFAGAIYRAVNRISVFVVKLFSAMFARLLVSRPPSIREVALHRAVFRIVVIVMRMEFFAATLACIRDVFVYSHALIIPHERNICNMVDISQEYLTEITAARMGGGFQMEMIR